MESEKVKEIKKALECCCNSCTDCPYDRYDKGLRCTDDLTKDALTLINELESENDTLHTNLCEWRKENQQLKDRIAELEKKNAKLLDSVETVQSNRCVYKCVLTKEHLTKFAERLKGRGEIVAFKEMSKGKFVYIYDALQIAIDETLKECLCEK